MRQLGEILQALVVVVEAAAAVVHTATGYFWVMICICVTIIIWDIAMHKLVRNLWINFGSNAIFGIIFQCSHSREYWNIDSISFNFH